MDGQQNLKKVEVYISKMPSLPVTVTKIMEIANNPKASPADLNKVISVDPVLMGRVLKLINSAYYGLSQEITSLVRAIIMLGINTVKNLALSTAILGTLNTKKSSSALNMDGFWRHSLCVGATSKIIAKHRKVDPKRQEEYFIAGLLHDIGKIPLNNRLPEEYIVALSMSDREQLPLYQAESQSLSFNHCDAGRLIVESWRLGDDIHDAVVHHHSATDYEGEHVDVLYTVVLANYFADVYEIGFAGDRYPEKVSPEVINYLGIDWNYLEDVEDQVNEEIDKARVFLNVAG